MSYSGIGLALSAFICAALHSVLEPNRIPSLRGLASAAAVGIVPWVGNQGFRRGDSQLLAVVDATPLCGAILLAMLGLDAFTLRLLIGGIVIVLAGMLSRT